MLSGTRTVGSPRSVISDSWQRSLAANVDPDLHTAPTVFAADELPDLRERHPLHSSLPVLRETLLGFAEEAGHIMIVTDAQGHILWCEGAKETRSSAEDVGLAEGTLWSEGAAGTNGMGTALAVNSPVTVHSAEHLVRTYHHWTCAACPIRDPDSGRTIGVVDLSGPIDTVHPSMVALVSASARLAESEMLARMHARDEELRARNMRHLIALRGEPGALLSPSGRVVAVEPYGLLPPRVDVSSGRVLLDDGREAVLEPLAEGYLLRVPRQRHVRRSVLSLSFLLPEPKVVLDGREVPISLRHAEILCALTLHGRLSADQLALRLYGERGNPTTVRAELHRLRAQLGGVLLTRPYRLSADVRGDFLAVREALRAGDVGTAAAAYRGELLPRSEAPVVREERDELAVALRSVVLEHGDVEALWAFGLVSEDATVLQRLARLLPRTDPRREVALTRLRRALA